MDDIKTYIYISWGWVCLGCFLLGVLVGLIAL